MKKREMSIIALTQTQSENLFYTLILEDAKSKRRLPIAIGASEAESIALGIESIPISRPLTHDLFKATLDQCGITVEEILIYKIDEENMVYFAYLSIRQGEKIMRIDCRPSDAIALAVRYNAPIYADEEVLEKAGAFSKKNVPEKEKKEKPLRQLSLEELNRRLTEAVRQENYENAIKLRDEINARSNK